MHINSITGDGRRCRDPGPLLDGQVGVAGVALHPDAALTASDIQNAPARDGQAGLAGGRGNQKNPLADIPDDIVTFQPDGQLGVAVLIQHPNGRATEPDAGFSILTEWQLFLDPGVVQGQDIGIGVIIDIVVLGLCDAGVGDIPRIVRCPVAGGGNPYAADIKLLPRRRRRPRRDGQQPQAERQHQAQAYDPLFHGVSPFCIGAAGPPDGRPAAMYARSELRTAPSCRFRYSSSPNIA